MLLSLSSSFFFFFNDTATTEIYTLSLHDALPISAVPSRGRRAGIPRPRGRRRDDRPARGDGSSHRDLLAEHVEVSGAWLPPPLLGLRDPARAPPGGGQCARAGAASLRGLRRRRRHPRARRGRPARSRAGTSRARGLV